MKTKKRVKKIEAWADVGSHGDILVYEAAFPNIYPKMMYIFSKKTFADLIPITITYEI